MKLILAREAEKDFDKLPKTEQIKAFKKLNLLEKDPFIGKKLSGKLTGFRSLRFWPYRIIYHLEKSKKEVWIDAILHRQRAYK